MADTLPRTAALHYSDLGDGAVARSAFSFLARFVWIRFRWKVMLLISATLAGSALIAFEPVFLGWLVEALRRADLQKPSSGEVWLPFVLVAVALVGSASFYRVRELIELHTAPQLRMEIQICLFSWLIEHAPDFFHRNFAGRLAQKIKQAGQSAITLLSILSNEMVRVIVMVGASMIIIGVDHPLLGLAIASWAILYIGGATLLSRRCQLLSRALSDETSASTGVLVDTIGNIEVVRGFARKDYECSRVAIAVGHERDASKRLRRFLLIMWSVLYTGLVLFQVAMIAFAVYETVQGRMVVGGAVTVISLSTLLLNNIWGAAARMLDFLEQGGILVSALDSIVQPHTIVDVLGAARLNVAGGTIGFQNVYFAHSDGTPVFENLNLEIKAGEKVGLVGPSGGGKSTLIKLLQRRYEPQLGRILIDGQDIARVTQQSLEEAIAEVPQEPGLFHRSIADNIRYARLDASDDDIRHAAKAAYCHDFIIRRPEGYASLVGEHGIQLSGGERQRIAIARALLKNARILILDEATSALDAETEHQIRLALWRLFEGRTVIAVAHRLSTISCMDRILYLEDGLVVEQGQHECLLASGGHYARMWQRQKDGFLVQ